MGELTSVGYSAALGRMVAMGFVYSKQPETKEEALRGSYEIEVSGSRVPAQAMLKAPWPAA